MSEIFLTAEAEEVRDPTNFSVVALFGFLFSAAGLFSIQYVQMMPIAMIGAALGAIALLTSKRHRIGFFSKSLGFLGLVIGAITVSFSLCYTYIENNYDQQQARKTAEAYLNCLSKGDLDHAAALAGGSTSNSSSEPGGSNKTAMSRVRDDPSHREISERKNPNWSFVTVQSEYASSGGHTYKLVYKDGSQTIPKFYSVFVRKNCEKYDKSRLTVNWFVDRLDSTTRS